MFWNITETKKIHPTILVVLNINEHNEAKMQLHTTPKFYSLDELALILGCAKNTLRYDPNFPKGLKIGKRRVVYDMAEVRAYLESNRVQ